MLRTIIKRPTPVKKALLQRHEIEQVERNGVRHYKIQPHPNLDPVYYPSVTTLLKELNKDSIQAWRDRVGTREANKKQLQGSRRGNHLHKLCEEYLLKGEVDVTSSFPIIRKLFKQVHPALDSNIKVLFGIELPLYSHELQTAGTADIIAFWGDSVAIVDFKTSTKKKDLKYLTNYFYQATAYAIMINEMYGTMPEKIVLVFGLEESEKCDIVVEDVSKYVEKVKTFFKTVERPNSDEELPDLPPWE